MQTPKDKTRDNRMMILNNGNLQGNADTKKREQGEIRGEEDEEEEQQEEEEEEEDKRP